jgi:hypothetical protein
MNKTFPLGVNSMNFVRKKSESAECDAMLIVIFWVMMLLENAF